MKETKFKQTLIQTKEGSRHCEEHSDVAIQGGFKMTEVGMIPSDWEVKFLSEIGSFSKGSGISRSESNSGNLPAIRYGEIYTKHNDYIKAFYSHISKEVANKSTRIYRGDVLFSASGETKEDIGKTVAFLESIEAYAGGDIIIMSPKCPVNSMFLGYILNFPAIAKQKAMKAQGDAVVHITTDSLRKLQVCIPKTTKEQQRIANALSDVDTLINNLEKHIAKKKNIKQGAMQQLLTGRKRLPGFGKPWIDKKLGEGLKFQCGAPFQSTYFNREHQGVRLIKNRDLKSDDQIYYYDGEYTYDYIVKNGNLLVGMDGDFMPCLWNKGTALLNQRVGRILTNCWSLPYLYYILIKPLLEKQDGTGATTVKHLSHRDVENMVVYMTTDIQEQTAIANVLSDMDTEISALETKLAKYRTLKTGMMQQLLTGKIRLI